VPLTMVCIDHWNVMFNVESLRVRFLRQSLKHHEHVAPREECEREHCSLLKRIAPLDRTFSESYAFQSLCDHLRPNTSSDKKYMKPWPFIWEETRPLAIQKLLGPQYGT
jgi:hypothetical protein